MRRMAAALAAAGALALPAAAQGTVYERGSYEDSWAFTYEDCGFPVDVSGSAAGKYVLKQGKHRSDQAFLPVDRYRIEETHVNAETGAWFTISGQGTFNEIKALPYDGTILEFHGVDAFRRTVRDADGELVMRDRGSVRFTYLFDTLGDSLPGGEWVADVSERINGPHPSEESDFCAMVTELIG